MEFKIIVTDKKSGEIVFSGSPLSKKSYINIPSTKKKEESKNEIQSKRTLKQND